MAKKRKDNKRGIRPGYELLGMLVFLIAGPLIIYLSKDITNFPRIFIIGFGVISILIGIHSFFNLLFYYDIVKDQSYAAPIMVVLAVIDFMCIGYYMFFNKIDFMKNSDKTEATVVYRDYHVREKDGQEEDDCTTEVKYYVDGKTYSSELGSKSCKYREGDKVKIYYDKNDPKNLDEHPFTAAIIGLITGIVLTFVCIGYIVLAIKGLKKKLKKK